MYRFARHLAILTLTILAFSARAEVDPFAQSPLGFLGLGPRDFEPLSVEEGKALLRSTYDRLAKDLQTVRHFVDRVLTTNDRMRLWHARAREIAQAAGLSDRAAEQEATFTLSIAVFEKLNRAKLLVERWLERGRSEGAPQFAGAEEDPVAKHPAWIRQTESVILAGGHGSFAERHDLEPGVWPVEAMRADGSVVLKTSKGSRYAVSRGQYLDPIAPSCSRIILGDQVGGFAQQHELSGGIWHVIAMASDGSVVLKTEDGTQYVVPRRRYTPVVSNDTFNVVLDNRMGTFAHAYDLPAGIWEAKAKGADGSIVIETAEGDQFVVPRGGYSQLKEQTLNQVILDDRSGSFADAHDLTAGLWDVQAVTKGGAVVIETSDGEQFVVPRESYLRTKRRTWRKIYLDTIFAENHSMDIGPWSVRAMGEDGSVVVRDDEGSEFVIPAGYYRADAAEKCRAGFRL